MEPFLVDFSPGTIGILGNRLEASPDRVALKLLWNPGESWRILENSGEFWRILEGGTEL